MLLNQLFSLWSLDLQYDVVALKLFIFSLESGLELRCCLLLNRLLFSLEPGLAVWCHCWCFEMRGFCLWSLDLQQDVIAIILKSVVSL